MSTYETLYIARNLIVKHGHIKGSYGHTETGFCAMGALAAAAESYSEELLADMAIRRQLRESTQFRRYPGILSWNDAPERTAAEVLDVFDKAIRAEGERLTND